MYKYLRDICRNIYIYITCVYEIQAGLYIAQSFYTYLYDKGIQVVHCTLYSVHCTLYNVHCTLCTVHRTQYTIRQQMYTLTSYNIIYGVHSLLHCGIVSMRRQAITGWVYLKQNTYSIQLLYLDNSIVELLTSFFISSFRSITSSSWKAMQSRNWRLQSIDT